MENVDVSLLTQYGAIGVVLVYFIIKDYKASKWQQDFKNSLDKFNDTLLELKARLFTNE